MVPDIERDVVDGVPVLRANWPVDRVVAALMFRVGRFDETLPSAGITHMVEHLTLTGKTDAPYSFNASVTGRYTMFYMDSGKPQHAADFIRSVCGGLTGDQSSVIDRERGILRTEAASRGAPGILGTCLAERYGATGPGLANYEEFGLHHLGWDAVSEWRSRWFTAGNAVLLVAGQLPPGLRIELPAGERPRQDEPVPLAMQFPGYLLRGNGGIGLSTVCRRSVGWHACTDILQRRMTQVLRHEAAVSYQVKAAVEELAPRQMHTLLVADALSEQLPLAAHNMLTTFEALAAGGCAQEELDAYTQRLTDNYESPSGPVGVLNRAAQALLEDEPDWQPDVALRAAAELTPGQTQDIAAAMAASAIVVTPAELPAVQGRMERLPAWSATTIGGTTCRSADSDAALTISEEGVMLTIGPAEKRQHVTVRYAETAALLRWNNGRQALVGRDGFAVMLDSDEWPRGESLLADIGHRVEQKCVVPIDEPGQGRPGRGTRAAPPVSRKWPKRVHAWRAVWVVMILLGVTEAATGQPYGVVIAGVGAGRMAWMEYRIRQLRGSRR